jgi:hypothetical protein
MHSLSKSCPCAWSGITRVPQHAAGPQKSRDLWDPLAHGLHETRKLAVLGAAALGEAYRLGAPDWKALPVRSCRPTRSQIFLVSTALVHVQHPRCEQSLNETW